MKPYADKGTVSIAMAVYNGEKYIEKQLESIRLQTREADEVIIIDDQSTDETYSLIQAYIKKYQLTEWKLYQNKSNQGYRINFFNCIEKTTGDIIFLCDQDDVWKQNKIECMEKMMKKHQQIQVLNTAIAFLDGQGKFFKRDINKNFSNEGYIEKKLKKGSVTNFRPEYLIEANISPGCSICFRSAIREKILQHRKFYENFSMAHDYFINILGSFYHGTWFWNCQFTNYRIYESNTIGIKREMKNFKDDRIKQGEELQQHYQEGVQMSKEYEYIRIIPFLNRQIKYHKLRTKAIERKRLDIYIKSLLLRATGCGQKITFSMIMVDIMYIFGIRYH